MTREDLLISYCVTNQYKQVLRLITECGINPNYKDGLAGITCAAYGSYTTYLVLCKYKYDHKKWGYGVKALAKNLKHKKFLKMINKWEEEGKL